jgi:threonine dehydratase
MASASARRKSPRRSDFAFANLRLVLEPGGAAALAAALAGKVAVDGRTAIVLSGGNVDPARFAEVLAAR